MIERGRHHANFYVMPNALADDERLSAGATGVLTYLLSKPDDWRVNVRDLMRRFRFGRDRALVLLKELIELGYIVRGLRDRVSNAFNYRVRDVPGVPAPARPRPAKQLSFGFHRAAVDPKSGNPDLGQGDSKSENPTPENTDTIVVNTESLQRTEIHKPGGARPRSILIPEKFEPDLAAAEKIGLTPEEARAHAERFVDRARAKVTRSLDWAAAWRDWCREAVDRRAKVVQMERRMSGGGKPRGKTLTEMLKECDDEIARRNNGNDQTENRYPGWSEHFAGPTLDLAAAA